MERRLNRLIDKSELRIQKKCESEKENKRKGRGNRGYPETVSRKLFLFLEGREELLYFDFDMTRKRNDKDKDMNQRN